MPPPTAPPGGTDHSQTKRRRAAAPPGDTHHDPLPTADRSAQDDGRPGNLTSAADDAEEFGVHLRAGGWRLGLLVARNVERNVGTGRSVPTGTLGKVSARAFADRAGTSAARVLRYLDAWDRAAVAGIVPAAVDLHPGLDLDLPDNDQHLWSDHYDAGRPKPTPKPPATFDDRCKAWVAHASKLFRDGARLAEEAESGEVIVGAHSGMALLVYRQMAERRIDVELRSILDEAES